MTFERNVIDKSLISCKINSNQDHIEDIFAETVEHVESGRRWIWGCGRTHQTRQVGETRRSGVEGRPPLPPTAAGNSRFGSSPWISGVRSELVGSEVSWTRDPLPLDSAGAGTLRTSWLLLLMCGATRSNFWLRMVRPDQVQNFAERHDLNVWRCFQALLALKGHQIWSGCCPICRCLEVVWGSVCAARSTVAPEVAEIMLTEVAPCFQVVRDCADTLREAGLVMPTWRLLADTPPTRDLQAEAAEPKIVCQTPRSELFGVSSSWPNCGRPSQTHRKHCCGRKRGPLASAAVGPCHRPAEPPA